MKKLKISFIKILIFITIMVIIVYLKQCINIKDDESTNSNSNEEVTASYGIKINSLKYDGDNISADITYDNGPIDCEVGITLFVNGISQPYYTDTHKEAYIVPYNLSKNTSKTIKLKFKPITGKKNDELSIVIGSMLNPSFKSNKTYGNNQKIFFLEPYTVICKKNNNNNLSFYKDSELKNFSKKEELNNNFIFNVLEGNKIVNRIKIRNNKIHCNINLYGKEEEYILSAYINHKIVPLFSDLYYAKVKSTKENISSISINFDTSDINLNKYNSFYIIAIPTHNDERAYKLDTIILEK